MTPDVVRDHRDNNGLSSKYPRIGGKEFQAVTADSSNPERPLAAEYALRDLTSATALCHSILDCDPSDACNIMAVAYESLRVGAPYGMPRAPFLGVMDEANFWAEMATRAELKAYCLACFMHLSASDRLAFLSFVQRSGAA